MDVIFGTGDGPMRMLIFSPLLLLSLGAMAPPQSAPQRFDSPAVSARKCPLPVVIAATPKPDQPAVRKLADEPPAALIAAVDVRHDSCPVMLVLAPGESALGRGWTPAPGGSAHPAE